MNLYMQLFFDLITSEKVRVIFHRIKDKIHMAHRERRNGQTNEKSRVRGFECVTMYIRKKSLSFSEEMYYKMFVGEPLLIFINIKYLMNSNLQVL